MPKRASDPGYRKVTFELRSEQHRVLRHAALDADVPTVAVIEALVDLYLGDNAVAAKVNKAALDIDHQRRSPARNL